MNKQTNRPTDKQTNKRANKPKDKQTDKPPATTLAPNDSNHKSMGKSTNGKHTHTHTHTQTHTHRGFSAVNNIDIFKIDARTIFRSLSIFFYYMETFRLVSIL